MTSLTTTTAVETSFVATTKDAGGGVDEMKQTETSANALAEVKQEKTIEMISNNNPITDIVKETNAMTAATTITSTAAATTTSMAAPTTAVAESVVAEATTATTAPKQISAVATTTTPPHTSAASKIPHLQQQHSPPFTLNRRSNQLLHSPDALRRSASLRMRGSKSNLFNNYDEHYMEMERSTRHLSYAKPPNTTTNTRYSQPLGGVLGEQQQQQQQGQSQKESDTNEQHTHIHAAGSFGGVVTPTTTTAAAAAATATATRRKATHLFGSTLSTQTPAMTVGNLTRSQSLRRSYLNYSYNSQQKSVKTDALKEQSADGASRAAGTTAATGTDVAIQETTATDNLSPLKINSSQSNGSVPNGCGKQENDIMYKSGGVGEQRRIDRDMQRMLGKGLFMRLGVTSSIDFLTPVSKDFSLNLNGSGGERTTTTKLPTAAAPAAEAASPVTPTGSGNTGTRITPANSISPKTPHNTAIPGQRYVKSSPNANPQETKLTPKTPPVTPDSPCTYLDDDLDSMYSFATTTSGRSTMSCEHPYVARNGTTFSGRKMKYVVHCSNYAGQVGPDYLTPTQRAARQVRRLKELLCLARQDLEQKDSEILRLTREVVELRLFKASLSSPEERSASSDAVTVREAELKTSQDVSPIVDMVDDATKSSPRHISNQHQLHHPHSQHLHHTQQLASEMQSSFADSGHFEDLSVHSKDSYAAHTQDIACGSDEVIGTNETVCHEACASAGAQEEDYAATIKNYELQRQELIRIYEQKIEELIRTQDGASSELKRSHNDKVEALLQKLAECNTRYADIVPDYEHAKERIRELEKQLEDLQRKLAEHEDKQNKMYLHMYQKGQEAERIARADQALELVHRAPDNKVSINELLHQLQSTQDELENIRAAGCRKESGSNHALLTAKEAISLWVLGARKTIYRRLLEAQKNRTHVDPEVTLQFLKSAIYYFLTDKENSQGHLQAIESILEFTEAEKLNISKARTAK